MCTEFLFCALQITLPSNSKILIFFKSYFIVKLVMLLQINSEWSLYYLATGLPKFIRSVPRVCGGDPMFALVIQVTGHCSPCIRGWFLNSMIFSSHQVDIIVARTPKPQLKKIILIHRENDFFNDDVNWGPDAPIPLQKSPKERLPRNRHSQSYYSIILSESLHLCWTAFTSSYTAQTLQPTLTNNIIWLIRCYYYFAAYDISRGDYQIYYLDTPFFTLYFYYCVLMVNYWFYLDHTL